MWHQSISETRDFDTISLATCQYKLKGQANLLAQYFIRVYIHFGTAEIDSVECIYKRFYHSRYIDHSVKRRKMFLSYSCISINWFPDTAEVRIAENWLQKPNNHYLHIITYLHSPYYVNVHIFNAICIIFIFTRMNLFVNISEFK